MENNQTESPIQIQKYHYTLPIGMSPSKIESIKEQLSYALNGEIEITTHNHIVTITCYKGSLPTDIPYTLPSQLSNTLIVPIGYSLSSNLITINMASDSHCNLLGGGYQGTGKSTLANGIIYSILQYPPEWVRIILIDLKMGVELKQWSISHPNHIWLQAYDPEKSELKHTLTMLNKEIRKRYQLFEKYKVKDIHQYRKQVAPLNYLFLVIDEFAELSSSKDGDDMQTLLKRTLQIGRAAGLRTIIFTQRPVVESITGSIKALFPDRIAMRCATKLESRIILDQDGAEQLEDTPGRALFLSSAKLTKVQVMNYQDEYNESINTTKTTI
jgi:DNA segregation ATPase FtsK/SpoIIIE-like protein